MIEVSMKAKEYNYLPVFAEYKPAETQEELEYVFKIKNGLERQNFLTTIGRPKMKSEAPLAKTKAKMMLQNFMRQSTIKGK